MSQRFLFLSGHLSGLLMGVLAAGIYFANQPTPVREVRLPIIQTAAPESTSQDPAPSNQWPSFQFNGQPVYIVPLAYESKVH